MRAPRGGAARASTRTTPVEQPSSPAKNYTGVSHSTPETPVSCVQRRWKHHRAYRRPLVSLSEVAVWATWILLTAAVLLAASILLTLVWPSPADAHVKTWQRVITISGSDEQYSGQYDSRLFKLKGGAQKLTAIVTPDPELAELDMADCWGATWFVEKQGGAWDWAYMTMDPAEGSGYVMTARFHLRKGSYRILPYSANCTWTATLWEKR